MIMFVYSWLMALIFVATLPLYLLLMRYSSRRVAPTYEGLAGGVRRAFARARSTRIKGIATVKAHGRRGRAAARAGRERARRSAGACSGRTSRSWPTRASSSVVTFVLVVVFLFIGALEVLAHDLTVGRADGLQRADPAGDAPLRSCSEPGTAGRCHACCCGRVQDIFDYGAEQHDTPTPTAPVPTLEGRVALRDAGFHYPSAPRQRSSTASRSTIPAARRSRSSGARGRASRRSSSAWPDCCALTDGSIAYDGVRPP